MSRALAGRLAAAYRFVSTLLLAFSSGFRSRSVAMARRAGLIHLDDVQGQLDSDDEFMAEGSDDDLDHTIYINNVLTTRCIQPMTTVMSHRLRPIQVLERQVRVNTLYMTVIIFIKILFFTEWSTSASPINITPCDKQAGPKVPLPSNPLGDDLISMIVRETNRYAEQALQGKNEVWSTDAAEIRAYLGFMILMGINELPELRDYWSTHEYLRYAPIADRISRNQFEKITQYLHFVDNTSLPSQGEGYSRLQKVEPVITALKAKFQYPHCQVSIDEAMIPFKGRSMMKQYVPIKPIKRGFKVGSSIDGYFCDLNVYVGATGERECSLGER